MKNNKKIIKKIKVVAKKAGKKTKVLMKKVGKKANKQAGKMVTAFKKEWKKEQPQREQYKKEIQEASEKGQKLFNAGLKNSIKIGGDVMDVIKKDIKEIYNKEDSK